MKSRILISGSQGYIGSVMADVFIRRGIEVVGLDTGFFKDSCFYKNDLCQPQLINKDIRTVSVDDLRGFDAVISLADLSNDPTSDIDQSVTEDINHKGVMHLANCSKAAGVGRFLYSSSCSVYGAAEGVVDEESKVNPQTTYARCKVRCERDLIQMADNNFSPTLLRNATVYGPSPRFRFDLVVNNLSGIAYTSKLIKMTSDGTPWRPLVHILDVVDAFYAVQQAPVEVVSKQIFNVGNNDNNYQVIQIAKAIAKVFTGCHVTSGSINGDTRSYKVNFDKINRHLPKYKSRRKLPDGIVELKELFDSIKLTQDSFQSRNFTRIKQIQYLEHSNLISHSLYWLK